MRGFAQLLLLAAAPALAAAEAELKPQRFTEHLIWGGFSYNWGVQAVDIDGDCNLDLTATDCHRPYLEPFAGERPAVPDDPALPHMSNLYWFRNDGHGNFTRHYLVRNDSAGRLERHVVADINHDGWPDIVCLDNFYGDLLWFENPGPKLVARDVLWKKHYITRGGMLGAEDLTVTDFDGDGKLDVAAAGWRLGNNFRWFKNPGGSSDKEWQGHTIDASFPVARSIVAADFNGDGRPDLLATSDAARIVLWYENPGPGGGPWRRHVIDLTTGQGAPVFGKPVDLNGDGRLDVLMVQGGWGQDKKGGVYWYENAGLADGRILWKKHLISDDLPGGFEVVAADIAGDGRLDVVATAETRTDGQVALFRNSGNPAGRWTKQILKNHWPMANQVIVADLDHDGRPDIIAQADYGSLELRWWHNDGRP